MKAIYRNIFYLALLTPWAALASTEECRYYFERLRAEGNPAAPRSHERSLEHAMLSDIIRDPKNIRPTAFDPDAVIRGHGVDTQKLSFQIEISSDNKPLTIRLVHADYGRIGYAHLSKITIGTKSYLQLSGIDLRPEFIGKGLGTLLYLSAGVQAKRMGSPLVSSPDTFNPSAPTWLSRGKSPQAEAAWVNLVKTGYAKELRVQENSSTYIYYIIDPVPAGTLLEKTEKFFHAHQTN